MLVANGPSVHIAVAAGCGAILLMGVVVGTGVAWLRGSDQTKRRWTRRAQHGDLGEDNATAERVFLFFLFALGAIAGAIYAALRLRPAWFGALTCYDLALLSAWLFVVAANGDRLHRAKG